MKIAVLVKEVPDTYGDRKLNLETGLTARGESEAVLDEIGERALEVALAFADDHEGTEIVLISMGPANAASTLRRGLAMGADRAIHVVDEDLIGADVTLTAEVLAAAVSRADVDLVIAGDSSTDGTSGMVPAALAELLSRPLLSRVSELEISSTSVAGRRMIETGSQKIAASLPAVVSITEAFPDARFPNFKGIMAAKKKPLETLALADLGLSVENVEVARSIMLTVAEKPPRAAGTKITDEGDAGNRLAEFLIDNRLA